MATPEIKIELTSKSRLAEVDFDNIAFGKEFSDHMFVADYKNGEWQDFRIVPFQNISVSPAFLSLHYGQSIFEGMKAHLSENNEIVLFRPEANFERLNRSADRLCIPQMDVATQIEGLKKLLEIDKKWIPNKAGSSLYIRPFIYATDEYIGVRPSDTYTYVIFTCPAGSYYDKPVKVKVETKYARACEGGVGFAKAAGNYAGSLYPTKLAAKEGFDQLIWTDAKEHKYIEESGTMNLMAIIDGTIVTPPAGETILGGITRSSVIQIAKDLGYKVEERKILVSEIVDAHNNGKLEDLFGTGTAVTITHIASFGFEGKIYELPAPESREISNNLKSKLEEIKRGKGNDNHNWVVKF